MDLVQLLDALQVAWPGLSAAQRVKLAAAAVELAEEFAGAVKEVEDDLAMEQSKSNPTPMARQAYRTMCDARSAAVCQKIAHADFGDPTGCRMRSNWTLLRLQDLEPGHHRWYRAKQNYQDALDDEEVDLPIVGPYGGDLET